MDQVKKPEDEFYIFSLLLSHTEFHWITGCCINLFWIKIGILTGYYQMCFGGLILEKFKNLKMEERRF
jgi:hypothetical protein